MPPRSPRHLAFGRAIRATREAVGLSQEALALAADLDRSYVGGIERGLNNPSLTNIMRLADTLQVPPSQLMDLAEKDPIWMRPPTRQERVGTPLPKSSDLL